MGPSSCSGFAACAAFSYTMPKDIYKFILDYYTVKTVFIPFLCHHKIAKYLHLVFHQLITKSQSKDINGRSCLMVW